MKTALFFVEYWVYFGEVGREEFKTWDETELFINHLRPGAMLNFGFIEDPTSPLTEQLEAA